MNKNRIWLFYFCICLASPYLFYGQDHNSISGKTKRIIDSTYNAMIKKYHVMGMSIAIVDSGKIVYATGYGFSDVLKKSPATEKTIYRIGSITKSFTALSILQLQEKGWLNINNSVKTYLPDLKITSRFKEDNPIIIKDILCHVSGLPCDIINGFLCDSPPNINWVIGELNKQTTISPRGYKQAYSNIGYGLLGEVIARAGKSTYSEQIKKNIFIPLEMNSSYIDIDERLAINFSKGYYRKKEQVDPLIRDQGAGMIHSNVLDMANYLKLYLNGGVFGNARLISQISIGEMEKNQMQNLQLPNSENYGYGLASNKVLIKKGMDSSVVRAVGHSGDTYIFHSDMKYIPELKVGVILLSNTDKNGWIVDANRLLKIYLKGEKGLKTNLSYKEPVDGLSPNPQESICSEAEMMGVYNFGSFVIHVRNSKKIKFKQGPATIKLSRKKNDPKIYVAKAFIFKIIPFKVKGQEFSFVKYNEDVYLKVFFTNSKEQDYFGIKTKTVLVSSTWKNKFGKYLAIGNLYPCKNCPFMNTEGMQMDLSQKKGFLLMKSKGKTRDTQSSIYLNIISDSLSVGGGIGRGTGETVRILGNGNIYYSGFEFKKQ